MFLRILDLLGVPKVVGPSEQFERVQVATCALLLEMAQADNDFNPLEEKLIKDLLEYKFDLSPQAQADLIRYSRRELDVSADTFLFTREINANFSQEEKVEILEVLWRLVYADGHLDKYEDALIRQIAHLLKIPAQQSIEIKIRTLNEAGSAE